MLLGVMIFNLISLIDHFIFLKQSNPHIKHTHTNKTSREDGATFIERTTERCALEGRKVNHRKEVACKLVGIGTDTMRQSI